MLDKIRAKRHAKVKQKFGLTLDKKQDKEMMASAVHKHEKHMHEGKKLTKLKDGGVLSEKKSHHRLDKLARGGKHKEPKTKVNVIVAPQGGKTPVPVPVPARGAMPPAGPMPAPGMPPMGANAPMGAGIPSNAPMKRGGRKYKLGGSIGEGMTAGSLSGEGRLEKIKLHRKNKGK